MRAVPHCRKAGRETHRHVDGIRREQLHRYEKQVEHNAQPHHAAEPLRRGVKRTPTVKRLRLRCHVGASYALLRLLWPETLYKHGMVFRVAVLIIGNTCG